MKIIEQIQRKDIFEHNYNVNDLLKHFYNVSPEKSCEVKPKRPPNSFMIFRAILGLVRNDKGFKFKDGTEQSQLAASFWNGASNDEKSRFKRLCSEFKKLHQHHFPNFKNRNKRAKRSFTIRSIKTAEFYRKNEISVSSDSYQNTPASYNIKIKNADSMHLTLGLKSYRSLFESQYKHMPKFKDPYVNIPL